MRLDRNLVHRDHRLEFQNREGEQPYQRLFAVQIERSTQVSKSAHQQ